MNAFARDAEGCGRFVLDLLSKRKKRLPSVSDVEFDDLIERLSTWAFHWAAKA